MKKEIYILLTRGNDGKFSISTYNTIEQAKKMLETYVSAQKDIEGVSAAVDIDDHKWEMLYVPGFILSHDAVISHVTVQIRYNGGKEIRTDRYIIKSTLNGYDNED